MRQRNVSIKLIERAVADKWMRHLAFFYMLKDTFGNSCLFDYRKRMPEIASRMGVSENTLRTHIRILKLKGLCHVHCDNLILESNRRFKSRQRCVILLEDGMKISDTADLLAGKLIERSAKRQMFMESLRQFESGESLKSRCVESTFRPSMSCRTIAKLLNCSEFKSHKVLKNLKRLGVLDTESQNPLLVLSKKLPETEAKLLGKKRLAVLVGGDTDISALENTLGYKFIIGNKLFVEYGQYITFNQFPLTLQPMTLNQFKAYKRRVCL